MGLLYYENLFSRLRLNKRGERSSPHKVAMLLAVMRLITDGKLTENKIYFDDQLKNEFTRQFDKLAGPMDRNNPHLPYFHLRSSDFWHHVLRPGKKESYDRLSTANSPGLIKEHIEYAKLDDELFLLLGSEIVRKNLQETLFRRLEEQERFSLLTEGNGWNWLECELVVDLYFRMLEMQAIGQPFVKQQLYSELVPRLNGRTTGAIESKCQNISAIMVQYGYPYVTGLRPRSNYQKLLEKVVLSQLVGQDKLLSTVLEKNLELPDDNKSQVQWDKVLDPDIPERFPRVAESRPEYLARKIDYSQRENYNRKLGERGEEFVLEFERFRMADAGRNDLVDEIEWTSKERGDGLGYDIASFNPKTDERLYIEVKTTNSGKYQPFFISANELSYAREFADKYSLYRVYEFKSNPRILCLHGEIEQYVDLQAKIYQARFSA